MKRLAGLFILPCALLFLAGCDLHSEIVERVPIIARADDAPAAFTHSGNVNEYGIPVTELYGGREPEFADKRDYVPPPEPPPPAPTPPPAPARAAEPDDTLLVPVRAASAPTPTIVAPTESEVVVQRGDTVFAISRRTGVPVRDLIEENKLRPPYSLAVGQRLKIPGARYHTVRSGETLYSISRAYSVDLNSLARENNLSAPFGLAIGQRLRLPGAVTPMAAARTATPAAAPAPATAATATTPAATPTITEAPTRSSRPTGRLPTTPARASNRFSWPVQGRIISPFGAKRNGLYNDGINIAARAGTPVKAAENGVVAYAGNELRGMGNLIIIQHAGGWMTVYAHLDTMTVRRGARVNVGEKIGTVGSTGRVTEPQLNFQIRRGTKAYNPATQLRR